MALPWTMPDPDHGQLIGAADCPTCWPTVPLAVREGMHCGYLPRETWREPGPQPISPTPLNCDICPGWLVRQDAVREAYEAYEAYEARIPERANPLRLRVVNEAAILMRRSFDLYKAERARRAKDRVEGMR